jgi:hypothetical protein
LVALFALTGCTSSKSATGPTPIASAATADAGTTPPTPTTPPPPKPPPNYSLGQCQDGGADLCLFSVDGSVTVKLPSSNGTAKVCTNHYTSSPPVEVIGDFVGDATSEVAVVYCADGVNVPTRTVLSVVDVSARVVVASVEQPEPATASDGKKLIDDSYTDYPRDPTGREYPILAPSGGDTLVNGSPIWGYLCAFDPPSSQGATRIAGSRCGDTPLTGAYFAKVSTVPPLIGGYQQLVQAFFRELGGWLEDLDGDGWEDISLTFHSLVLTISNRTGQQLSATTFNVADTPLFLSPHPSRAAPYEWFHSGRNYGIHAVVPQGAVATHYVSMNSGAPVGNFKYDIYCGPSRFVGVLASTPDAPASRSLAWSAYFGFGSHDFTPLTNANDPNSPIYRYGDMANGCINRFGDGLSKIDGNDVLIYNHFVQTNPDLDLSPAHDFCKAAQLTFYATGDPTAEFDCWSNFLKAPGSWHMQARAVKDGTVVSQSADTYVWGMSDRLLPTAEKVYLVQLLPSQGHKFDMTDVPPSPIAVMALVNSSWTSRGTLPKAGLPKILMTPTNVNPAHGLGITGLNSSFAYLTTRPSATSGLEDILMEDGTWVGYDPATKSFIVK